jgi:hypothetical protein
MHARKNQAEQSPGAAIVPALARELLEQQPIPRVGW